MTTRPQRTSIPPASEGIVQLCECGHWLVEHKLGVCFHKGCSCDDFELVLRADDPQPHRFGGEPL